MSVPGILTLRSLWKLLYLLSSCGFPKFNLLKWFHWLTFRISQTILEILNLPNLDDLSFIRTASACALILLQRLRGLTRQLTGSIVHKLFDVFNQAQLLFLVSTHEFFTVRLYLERAFIAMVRPKSVTLVALCLYFTQSVFIALAWNADSSTHAVWYDAFESA